MPLQLCAINPRAQKYSLVEDYKVDAKDRVYIEGDAQHGNVASSINSCKYCKDRCNVHDVFSPGLPPWFKGCGASPNIAEFGYIYVEIVRHQGRQ